ncbi:macro domain-containing protein [Oscillatoria amoena NRMC-F 0135]|nr:macro domain-containing protein [Oscillatoria laete-virens]MDL5049151.1 macro domain-containing protein [Oscillatoria amoena NRMC-F 0135]MDL5052183.1 macro domain-containing protein [Oscillatoria laete-virens NRMC-F 0139]
MKFTQGNLLEAKVEAYVNTVNTVGVMGKGIALMFKERFPENYEAYIQACKDGRVNIGEMFVTPVMELGSPRWIINFPTKKHWRHPSRLEWIESGLIALRRVIIEKGIKSLALPPLGCGNGGLDWNAVSALIRTELGNLPDVEIIIFEPTEKYQNVAKRTGVEKLTPARALIAEMIRRYWVLGIECTLLEVQKLAWFLERSIRQCKLKDPMDLKFQANRYGPYSPRLTHLLESLDGSYLHCEKRLKDASPFDTIWFDEDKKQTVEYYLRSEEAKDYLPALERTDDLIDGFQSPLGMESLATVDWLIYRENIDPVLPKIKEGILKWPAGRDSAERKARLFDDQLINLTLNRLIEFFPSE